MKRFIPILSLGAIASVFPACSEDPAVAADPCATPPVISEVKVTDSPCGSPAGSVLAVATGGSGTLQYSLDGKEFRNNGEFINLANGNYTLTVKDVNDCRITRELVVNEVNNINLSIASVTPSGCGTSEGEVSLEATGGSENYSYSLDGTTYQPETVFRNLPSGKFTAFVKDDAGCVSNSEFILESGVSFKSSVKSIFEMNCAVTGCHVSGTKRVNLEEFDGIQKNASRILSLTKSGAMPPKNSGKQLTASEVDLLACWINDGAKAN